jgi:hypothetical protein
MAELLDKESGDLVPDPEAREKDEFDFALERLVAGSLGPFGFWHKAHESLFLEIGELRKDVRDVQAVLNSVAASGMPAEKIRTLYVSMALPGEYLDMVRGRVTLAAMTIGMGHPKQEQLPLVLERTTVAEEEGQEAEARGVSYGIDHNRAVQFASLLVLFMCLLSLPLWFAYGVILINPFLSGIGILAACFFWLMAEVSRRQLLQLTSSERGSDES